MRCGASVGDSRSESKPRLAERGAYTPNQEKLMTNWHLARGYRFAGVHSGLRPDPERLDLALVVSDTPAAAAGAFTQNRVVAAPVHVCRERLPTAEARGVVVCSGNANA